MRIKLNLGLNTDSVREFSATYLRYLTQLSKMRYPAHEQERALEHEQQHVGDNLLGKIQM